MRTLFLFFLTFLTYSLQDSFAQNSLIEPSTSPLQNANKLINNQSVIFTENNGQFKDMDGNSIPFVLFKLEAPQVDLFITETGLTYLFKEEKELDIEKETSFKWERVDLLIKDANIKKKNIIASEPVKKEKRNYYIGNSQKPIEVNRYKKITVKNIYPNIDWILYNSNGKGFKYDFILHPGANSSDIRLIYQTLEQVSINNEGAIHISTQYGEIIENAPVTFFNGEEIESRYQLQSVNKNELGGYNNLITFEIDQTFAQKIASSNKEDQLIIDPQILWFTLFGGNDYDAATSIVIDDNDNLFVTGFTRSTNFPTQTSGNYFQGTASGDLDIFLLKFDPNSALLWSTYYGGADNESSNSIVIDNNSNIFITGLTKSGDLPLLDAGTYYQGTKPCPVGEFSSYILKFDNNGNRLWATYYGGSTQDQIYSLAIDNSDNIFMVGRTKSTDLPLQDAGTFFQSSFGGGTYDGFILKFDNLGNRLWATYVGGTDEDYFKSVAVDNNDMVFTTGVTKSTNFPTQNGGGFFQATNAGGYYDLTLLKFDNLGNNLWSTYYGGTGLDAPTTIACDGLNNIFVTGETSSADFPLQDAGTFYQGTYISSNDNFILKFDQNLNRQWATYYGGSNYDFTASKRNIEFDLCNNVYIIFNPQSDDVTTQSFCDGGYYQSTQGGIRDIVLLKFSNTGVLHGATYLGGDGSDKGGVMDFDSNGDLFFAGYMSVNTISTYNFITDMGGGSYFDNTPNGSSDAIITKIQFDQFQSNLVTNDASCTCTGDASVTITGGCAPYDFIWSNGSQTLNTNNLTDGINSLCGGNYEVAIIDSMNCHFDTIPFIINSAGNVSNGIDTQTSCGSFTWIDGNTYTTSNNTATFTIVGGAVSGCDSIVTLDLTILTESTSTFDVTICNGDSILINGNYEYTTGIYPDTIVGGSASGCDSIIQYNLTTLNPSTSNSNISICAGDSILINGNYESTAGVYTDTISGGSHTGCDSIISITLSVIDVIADFSFGDTAGCSVLNSDFTDLSSSSENITSWQWDFGDGSTSTNQHPTNQYLQSGTFNVTLIVTTASGCQANTTQIINTTISQQPTANFTFAPNNPQIDELVDFVNTSNNATSWEWDFGNNQTTTITNPSNAYSSEGTYTVTLTAYNGSCSDVASQTIQIESNLIYFVPNSFTPGGADEFNNIFQPVFNSGIDPYDFQLLIYNRWGDLVFESYNPEIGWDGTYNGKYCTDGTYIWTIRYKLINKDKRELIKGHVNLLR